MDYDKLRRKLRGLAHGALLPEQGNVNNPMTLSEAADAVLDTIWPEIVDLLAKILEYEHALEHATDPHDGPVCSDCQRLCQSALDGVNRDGFREVVTDNDGPYTDDE